MAKFMHMKQAISMRFVGPANVNNIFYIFEFVIQFHTTQKEEEDAESHLPFAMVYELSL